MKRLTAVSIIGAASIVVAGAAIVIGLALTPVASVSSGTHHPEPGVTIGSSKYTPFTPGSGVDPNNPEGYEIYTAPGMVVPITQPISPGAVVDPSKLGWTCPALTAPPTMFNCPRPYLNTLDY